MREDYVAAVFAAQLDGGVESRELDAISNYVAGVYTPNHHNLYFEGIGTDMQELAPPVADFVRRAAWAFLCAWTQRYGGLNDRQRTGYSLIDPNA